MTSIHFMSKYVIYPGRSEVSWRLGNCLVTPLDEFGLTVFSRAAQASLGDPACFLSFTVEDFALGKKRYHVINRKLLSGVPSCSN